ncbi:amidase domain-containing protein [Agromyces sp. H3Y2-19a]|uniref:amidase domain-containing protein n=1 Tax=Agromyces TaxID=33877 RepID=UPI001E60A01C|nr:MULTISPECIES: amidase domain-containing protein [Agromyces]MCD5348279.1 amidase domain-containing protein [Agromyces sp. S2-1-8]MDF0514116.1 amidase domain-containing protein [Agromyces chromiiresistens]
MSQPPHPRALPRRAVLIGGGVAAVAATGGALAWLFGQSPAPSAASADSIDAATARPTPGADARADSTVAAAAVSPAVAAQLAYLRAHWQDTSSEEFGYIDENDCVNFASQGLLARGWTEDDEWWYSADGDPWASSDAWISSTVLRDYLELHPERATALDDTQRSLVKPGDLVQFDWDGTGDRDHTGTVTAVVVGADGAVSIEYAGHTDATWDRTVDEAITEIHPGGVAYYWSIPE